MRTSLDLTPLGLAVGHATDDIGATGITVIRGIDHPLRAGVAIFGRATGSRELHAASSEHLVDGRVDAIVLTGGSAYGLDATAGVMRWMEEHNRGLPVGPGVVPIIPAVVVYDLAPLGKFESRPTPQMAYAAAANATSTGVEEGSVGAGTGTTVGKMLGPSMAMKGGFGCAVMQSPHNELRVAAMVVVNAFGDVRDESGRIIAGARNGIGGFVDTLTVLQSNIASPSKFDDVAHRNTTLAVVACSAPLDSDQLTQLARAAGAALFRRITPAGSSFDGDVIFAVSPQSGKPWELDLAGRRGNFEPMVIESLAVAALEDAIERAVRLARGRDGVPGLADGDV